MPDFEYKQLPLTQQGRENYERIFCDHEPSESADGHTYCKKCDKILNYGCEK